MYVSRQIQIQPIIREALVPVIVAAAWALTVVFLHEFAGFDWIVLPVLPVTLVGIAVSLYVAFKSASAYKRWWEARTAIGLIFAQSRELISQVHSFVQTDPDKSNNDIVKRILRRHLGWVYLAAHILRRQSRLQDSSIRRMFGYRCTDEKHVRLHQHGAAYTEFLDPEECKTAEAFNNPPTSIMLHQAEDLKKLAESGSLDPVKHVALMELLGRLTVSYGICERIKFTPFPRLVTHFGKLFTWVLVFMLPLAFLDVFEKEAERNQFSTLLTHEYILALVPFSVLISWIFLMMEKVSESHADPFEGGINDVPLSSILRLIEIDIKQALQEEDIPSPLEPADDTMY
ncbi:MAG: bestrophin family protein [Rhizobiaceae bacterium]